MGLFEVPEWGGSCPGSDYPAVEVSDGVAGHAQGKLRAAGLDAMAPTARLIPSGKPGKEKKRKGKGPAAPNSPQPAANVPNRPEATEVVEGRKTGKAKKRKLQAADGVVSGDKPSDAQSANNPPASGPSPIADPQGQPKKKSSKKNKFKQTQTMDSQPEALDSKSWKNPALDDGAPESGPLPDNRTKLQTATTPAGDVKVKGVGKGSKPSSLLDKMRAQLQGGQFRWLNETMYTQPGESSFEMMQQDPALFDKYHQGFRSQTLGWPKLPVDVAIKWLKGKPASLVVADFGCGDAKLAGDVKQKVYSLDLVSVAPGVIACDMANTPLEDSSVDVAVFCLALMGTNYPSFLAEAFRVLRPGGTLWVAEVRSRFASDGGATEVQGMKDFVSALRKMGFVLRNKDASNKMFVIVELAKGQEADLGPFNKSAKISWPSLKACTYKKR